MYFISQPEADFHSFKGTFVNNASEWSEHSGDIKGLNDNV